MKLFKPGQWFNKNSRVLKKRFQDIIASAMLFSSTLNSVTEKSVLFDFMIWSLGQQIVADSYMAFLTYRKVTEDYWFDLRGAFPFIRAKASEADIDIAKCTTYTGPWNVNRFPECFLSVAAHGFLDSENNTKGIYYPELHFAVMNSGKHHTSWAIFLGECKTSLNVVSLKEYFPVLTTDGATFTYSDQDTTLTKQAADYRFAAMYRLAQIKWENDYPDTVMHDVKEHRTSMINLLTDHLKQADNKSLEEAWQTMFKYTEEYRTKYYIQQKEAEHWKLQCSRKDQHIQELEKQLLSSNRAKPE